MSEELKVKPAQCSACGKSMIRPDGRLEIPLHFQCNRYDPFAVAQFGRFTEPNYSFCHECLIWSIMGSKK